MWKFKKNNLDFKEVHFGSVRFISSHQILHQFCEDLANGLNGYVPQSGNMIVYCGAHRPFGWRFFRRGFKVALQTEQFFDANGKRLWGSQKKGVEKNIRRALKFADAFLDINCSNKKFYDDLRLPKHLNDKISFGPCVFPNQTVRHSRGRIKREAIFFGGIKDRRRTVLDSLENSRIFEVPKDTYGDQLSKLIERREWVLNIHFQEGIYTECPRLLTAFLHGKAVISETLDEPFEASNHYVLPGSESEFDSAEIFLNFSKLATAELSFSGYLDRIGA